MNLQHETLLRLLSDGDHVVGAFCGNLLSLKMHQRDGRFHSCTEVGCSQCQAGIPLHLHALSNFYVPDINAMKVISLDSMQIKQLGRYHQSHNLQHWLFEITRHGKNNDPNTTYTIAPTKQMDKPYRKPSKLRPFIAWKPSP